MDFVLSHFAHQIFALAAVMCLTIVSAAGDVDAKKTEKRGLLGLGYGGLDAHHGLGGIYGGGYGGYGGLSGYGHGLGGYGGHLGGLGYGHGLAPVGHIGYGGHGLAGYGYHDVGHLGVGHVGVGHLGGGHHGGLVGAVGHVGYAAPLHHGGVLEHHVPLVAGHAGYYGGGLHGLGGHGYLH